MDRKDGEEISERSDNVQVILNFAFMPAANSKQIEIYPYRANIQVQTRVRRIT